ncbi:hypothetical protein ACVGOW_16235 [Pseudonocardia saturnea]
MNDGERGLPRVPMARDASEARGTVPAVPAPRGSSPGVRVPRPRGAR